MQAPSGTAFTSIAAGGAFTVGLTTSGTVDAWGANALGQLGDGSTDGAPSPVGDGAYFSGAASLPAARLP